MRNNYEPTWLEPTYNENEYKVDYEKELAGFEGICIIVSIFIYGVIPLICMTLLCGKG